MSSTGESVGIFGAIALVIALAVLPVIGYVTNIVKLCQCDFKTPYKAELVRGVGVVVPVVGMVTGYLTIKDRQ